MAEIKQSYNEVEPTRTADFVPAGEYVASITESGWEMTKNKDGRYLSLWLKIDEGTYAGSEIQDRLNMENTNADAVRIACQTWGAIRHATGVLRPRDSKEVHRKKMLIVVTAESYTNQHGSKLMVSRVKKYKKLDADYIPKNETPEQRPTEERIDTPVDEVNPFA